MSEQLAPNNNGKHYYQHSARPEWGAGIVVWEREGKRGYQFADGQLRVFKDGYFHLLAETQVSPEQREHLAQLAGVQRQLAAAPIAIKEIANAVSFSEQITYFRAQFGDGFTGKSWRAKHRAPAGRAGQRHRDPAIELATTKLSREQLDQHISAGNHHEVVKALREVLARTNLVSPTHRKRLLDLGAWQEQRLALALRELLWGAAPIASRLSAWISTLATTTLHRVTPWSLATAPLALVFPDEHVCVAFTSFRAQGSRMVPLTDPGRSASATRYAAALAVARRVRDRLREDGLEPADLLDVYDFMALTQKKQARAEIVAARSSMSTAASPQAGAQESTAEESLAAA